VLFGMGGVASLLPAVLGWLSKRAVRRLHLAGALLRRRRRAIRTARRRGKPAAVFAHETADFVQAMPAPAMR
jgi:hypothetical protein